MQIYKKINKRILVKGKDLVSLLTLIIFIEMPIIASYGFNDFIDMIFDYSKILFSMVILLGIIFKAKYLKSARYPFVLILLIWAPQIISTFVNQGDIKSAIYSFIVISVPCVWFYLCISEDFYHTIKIIMHYLGIVAVLNLLTMLIYPNGLINSISMYGDKNEIWLLGQKNGFVAFCLPLLCFSLIELKYLKNKTSLIYIVVSVVTVFWGMSSTGIVGIALMLLIVLFVTIINKKNLFYITRLFNIHSYLIAVLIILIMFVFFSKIEVFSFLIVNILKKDLTLTTRVGIWGNTLSLIEQRTMLGYGFRSYSNVNALIGASHQHNYYLHLLFQGGIIALSMFSVFVMVCAKKLDKYRLSYNSIVISATIFSFMIMCITEVYSESVYLLPSYLIFIAALALTDVEKPRG